MRRGRLWTAIAVLGGLLALACAFFGLLVGFEDDWIRPPRAGLNPIGVHEARHTFASLMIAAGVNARALSTYTGHSSITITLDLYGHLMPGNEEEAAGLLEGLPGATGHGCSARAVARLC